MATACFTPKLAMHAQPHSPLFNKLPPELRNYVYRMTFESEFDSIDHKRLFRRRSRKPNGAYYDLDYSLLLRSRSAPPSPSLLQCCQAIQHEANQLFTAALEAYLRHTEFVFTSIRRLEPEPAPRYVPFSAGRSSSFFAHIRHCSFVLQASNNLRVEISLKWSAKGGWDCTVDNRSPSASLKNDEDKRALARFIKICHRLLTKPNQAYLQSVFDRYRMERLLTMMRVFQDKLEYCA